MWLFRPAVKFEGSKQFFPKPRRAGQSSRIHLLAHVTLARANPATFHDNRYARETWHAELQ
jgi:hypothetical protein